MPNELLYWKICKLITQFELAIHQPNNMEAVNFATEAKNIGVKDPVLAKIFDLPNRFSKHGIHV